MRAEADYRSHHPDELHRLQRENAALRYELQRKDAALLQLRTHFALGRQNIAEAEAVFADLDPPPLINVVVN